MARAATAPWNQDRYDTILQNIQAHQTSFPPLQCNILAPQYAGLVRQVVDGIGSASQQTVWYYGDAINAAVADCHNAGGGTVVVPADGSLNGGGVYYSGAITLLSNVDLEIDTGATVAFVRNPTNEYYPLVPTSNGGTDVYNFSPMVYALNQTNIAITGGGTLDAQYNVSPWALPSPKAPGAGNDTVLIGMDDAGTPEDQRIFTSDGTLPSQIPMLEGCPAQTRDWGPCKGVQDAAPAAGAVAYQSTLAPQFVEFNHCSTILMQDVHIVNTQFWEVHPLNSEYAIFRNLTITDTAHETDGGIVVESSRDVLITGNQITTVDDGVGVHSGRNLDGLESRAASTGILVENNTFTKPLMFGGGFAAIGLGSAMSGGVRNVFLQDDTASGPGLGELLYLRTNSYRGGAIQNVYVRNSTVGAVSLGVVRINASYAEADPQSDGDVFDPTIRGVFLDNVDTSAPSNAPPIDAVTVSRSPVANVWYTNSTIATTSSFEASFAQPGSEFLSGLKISNVTLTNPTSQASTVYSPPSLALANQTAANTAGGAVPLTASPTGCTDCTINQIGTSTFTLSGKVSDYRVLKPTVQVFLDRGTTPIPVTIKPDGSFQTDAITLGSGEYWCRGYHYLSVNLLNGAGVNTVVYRVAS